MNEDSLKVMATRFEGRGHIDVTIERCIDTMDKNAPVACRIAVEHREGGTASPDDALWLEDIADLEVLHDAIAAYLLMLRENRRRKGGGQ